MRTAATLGAFAAGLAVVFGAAVGVGSAVGPVGTASERPVGHAGGDGHDTAAAATAPSAAAAAAPVPGGLSVAQDGYALRLDRTTLPAGTATDFGFTVVGPDGRPLTDYVRSHDKDLHLIVVRRDMVGFQHLHPTRDDEGRWSLPLTLADPGTYKVFADFVPAGRDRALTLAADVTVPGAFSPRPLPAPSDTAVTDGYQVALDGQLVAGTSSELTLTVTRDGRPVTDLEPYLGAYGHLVALRDGDLAYLHVHPEEGSPAQGGGASGPGITFSVDVPTAGAYRLFLDFQHDGVVRTAELTAVATAEGAAPAPATSAAPDHGTPGHGH